MSHDPSAGTGWVQGHVGSLGVTDPSAGGLSDWPGRVSVTVCWLSPPFGQLSVNRTLAFIKCKCYCRRDSGSGPGRGARNGTGWVRRRSDGGCGRCMCTIFVRV